MVLGSACVPRVGDRVFRDHGLFCGDTALSRTWQVVWKDCFGATPKPARETRALTKRRYVAALQSFRFDGVTSLSQIATSNGR
jgi:hypothetical protein